MRYRIRLLFGLKKILMSLKIKLAAVKEAMDRLLYCRENKSALGSKDKQLPHLIPYQTQSGFAALGSYNLFRAGGQNRRGLSIN
jgi:hypothetical protein